MAFVQGPKKWFAKCDKHYPSRFRQISLATAVTNFTKPRTSHFFGLCINLLPTSHRGTYRSPLGSPESPDSPSFLRLCLALSFPWMSDFISWRQRRLGQRDAGRTATHFAPMLARSLPRSIGACELCMRPRRRREAARAAEWRRRWQWFCLNRRDTRGGFPRLGAGLALPESAAIPRDRLILR